MNAPALIYNGGEQLCVPGEFIDSDLTPLPPPLRGEGGINACFELIRCWLKERGVPDVLRAHLSKRGFWPMCAAHITAEPMGPACSGGLTQPGAQTVSPASHS